MALHVPFCPVQPLKNHFEPITKSDLTVAALLLLAALFSTIPFLHQLEFFRHTEADRTLIAWEMLRSGNWLVPHLLGDLYLTKPPLFYQLLASLMYIFGNPSEFVARLPSALAFSGLISTQYIFARFSTLSKATALLSAVALATSAQLFTASMEAEIDMTLTFSCATACWAAYLTFNAPKNTSSFFALLVVVASAAGFLIKGPPGIFFPFISAAVYYFWLDRSSRSLIIWLLALLATLAIIGAWILLLTHEIPADLLWYHFKFEVLNRVQADPLAEQRGRSAFYYLGTLLAGGLPWSLALFLPSVWKTPSSNNLLRYCASLIIPSLLIFSLSSGKSSRYLLPLIPFFITWITVKLSMLEWFRHHQKRILFAVVAIFLLARASYSFIYAPQRNRINSVKPIASQIKAAVTTREVFILEMFERWLPYYLLQEGILTKRLTPALQTGALVDDQSYYVIISSRSEEWRLPQLLSDSTTHLTTYPTAKGYFALLETSGATLKKLPLSEIFPTVSTNPSRSPSRS